MPFAGYEDFDACVADNQDVDDPEAYCAEIKRQVEGQAALSDAEADALSESDCPEGHVMVAGECRPVEEVDAPPAVLADGSGESALPSSVHLAEFDPETIERREEADGKVRYSEIKVLGPGKWTDSGSRETIWYSPELMNNLSVDPENSVHIMHDSENEVSEVGHLDPESVINTDRGVFADLVIDTSTPAGQFADENMQQTLETGGAQGFGGPSVEIPPEGQVVEYNHREGMDELKDGVIDGMGLVKNPASKDVHFARQTAQRGVAMAEADQSVMELSREADDMAPNAIELDNAGLVRTFGLEADDLDLDDGTELEDIATADLRDLMADALGVDTEQVTDALAPLLEDEEDGDEEGDCPEGHTWDAEAGECVPMDDDGEGEEGEGEGEGDNPPPEMEAEEMQNKIQSLEERLQNLEDMIESAMAQEDLEETREDLSTEIEETRDELADAETVRELEAKKEDLEERLAALENESEDPKTLAGAAGSGGASESENGTISNMDDVAGRRY